LNDAGVVVVIITNQSGIAQGFFTEEDYAATADRTRAVFHQAGATIDGMYHCPHHPELTGPCDCRKPGTLLHRRAAQYFHIDLTRSAYIGDRLRDVLPSQSLGGIGILIPSPHTPSEERNSAERDFVLADSLGEAVEIFLAR
jgi:D-glycero-D-manno-heptose 1,7-bisphosphate phosphatase